MRWMRRRAALPPWPAAVGADTAALHRLLYALASIGLVTTSASDQFALTPVGACLRSDAAHGLRSWALMESAEYYQTAWDHLLTSVRSGAPAFLMDHDDEASVHRGQTEVVAAKIGNARLAPPSTTVEWSMTRPRGQAHPRDRFPWASHRRRFSPRLRQARTTSGDEHVDPIDSAGFA